MSKKTTKDCSGDNLNQNKKRGRNNAAKNVPPNVRFCIVIILNLLSVF